MEIKDYSLYERYYKTYLGSEDKISLMLDDGIYMMKAPTKGRSQRGDLTGSIYNNVLSEHMGSHIFESVGIPVQETKLGYYKGQLVVLCKDFVGENEVLQEFQTYKNGFISPGSIGRTAEISEIMSTIKENSAIPDEIKDQTIERFWETFVLDALIANPDRHNGNWGFLFNLKKNEVRLAPVYDCGASLFARMSDQVKEGILSNRNELNLRIFNRPLSALTVNGKKVHYYEFMNQTEDQNCICAMKRIIPQIDLDKINRMIQSIPVLSDLNKQFYCTILSERYQKVLIPAHKKIMMKEKRADIHVQKVSEDSALERAFGVKLKEDVDVSAVIVTEQEKATLEIDKLQNLDLEYDMEL